MDAPKHAAKELMYGGYVVAVLDILGQRDAIRALAKLQPRMKDKPKIIRALKDSLGVRDGVRKRVKSLFDEFTGDHADPRYSLLNNEQRAAFDRINHRAIKTYGFGDAFVAYAPIITPQGDPSIRDIYRMIAACASSMLVSIASGKPVRGAIELGFGLEPEDNEVYGPAFLAAFDLQEVVAQHPRIIVGDELRGYLDCVVATSNSDQVGSVLSALAGSCTQLIARDEDGCFILDYLGEGLRQIAEAEPDAGELFERGFEFVRQEQRRFIEERNPKLAARYAALVRYFSSRSAGWQKPT